ncbi:MAG: hypothetical protein ABSG01_14125 [Anaerolineales bacterium]
MAVLPGLGNKTAEQVADGRDEIDELVIIHHQHKMLVDAVTQLVDQAGEQPLGILFQAGDRAQDGIGTFAESGVAFCHGGDQVGDEALGVLIEGIQREPADRHLRLARKIDQQGGLAVPGRGGDDDQFLFQEGVELRQQARPVQHLRAKGRNDDLGSADGNSCGGHGLLR